MPFLVPYMTAAQVAGIPGHFLRALGVVGLLEPQAFSALPSMMDEDREGVLRLLNHPTHVDRDAARRFTRSSDGAGATARSGFPSLARGCARRPP